MAWHTISPLPNATVGTPYSTNVGYFDAGNTVTILNTSSNAAGFTVSQVVDSITNVVYLRIAFQPAAAVTITFGITCSVSYQLPPVTISGTVICQAVTIPGEDHIQVRLNPPPNVIVDQAFSFSLGTVTVPAAGVVTWSLGTNPPSGVALSSAGVLSGTVTLEQAYEVPYQINAAGYALWSNVYRFTATAAPTTAIDASPLNQTTTTGAFSDLIVDVRAPVSFTCDLYDKGNLPVGAALSSSGNLTATFASAGTYRFKSRVRATGLSPVILSHQLIVTASPSVIQYTRAALPNATANTPYSQSLGTVSVPSSNATWALTGTGNLPNGADVSSAGLFTATFTINGAYYGTVTISANGYTDATFQLEVNCATTITGIKVTWADLTPTKGVAYSHAICTLIEPTSDVRYELNTESGTNLPQGITLNRTTGALAGTFSAEGVYTAIVRLFAENYAMLEHELRVVCVAVPGQGGEPPPPKITTESYSETEWLLTKTITDDGNGLLTPTQDSAGRLRYDTGVLYFPPEQIFNYKRWSLSKDGGTGTWTEVRESDTLYVDTRVDVTYQQESVIPTSATETLPTQSISFSLTPYTTDSVVPGSVQFKIGNTIYTDLEGIIYHTPDNTGYGTEAGVIDYATGEVVLTNWVAGSSTFEVQSLATLRGQFTETSFRFRTAMAPLRPTGFQFAVTAVDGELLAGTADLNGTISGDAMEGTIDTEFGVISIRFGEMVDVDTLTNEEKAEEWYDEDNIVNGEIWYPRKVIPGTARYNAVAYSSLPLSADLLGLDPVRLPSDGRVPCIIKGDMAVVQHHTTHSVATPVAGGTLDTELTSVARVRVYDAGGLAVPPSRYSLAQDTGILTWANPLDLAGFTGPYSVEATIEDAALVTDADISGRLLLNRALTHTFPIGSTVSSAYVFGDLFAQVTTPFSQQAWTSVWQSTRVGLPILAQYNSLLYPIEMNNASSWRERWLLLFTSQTSFRVIGETLGDITDALGGAGYHDIDHDLAPVNPLTATPYFTLPYEGWSSGWVAGNCLRFDTLPPANFPVWIAMTVHPSAPTTGQDRFRLLLRGGIDA